MTLDSRTRNFPRLDGQAIECGYHSDHVGLHMVQEQVFWPHAMLFSRRRRDHEEQGGVNAIGARGEDSELPSLFSTVEEKFACILEIVAIHDATENALGR